MCNNQGSSYVTGYQPAAQAIHCFTLSNKHQKKAKSSDTQQERVHLSPILSPQPKQSKDGNTEVYFVPLFFQTTSLTSNVPVNFAQYTLITASFFKVARSK